jgi:hypothetical protein
MLKNEVSVRFYRDVSHEARRNFQWLVYLLECHKHLLAFSKAIISCVPVLFPKAYLLCWQYAGYRPVALTAACRFQTSGADIWYRQDISVRRIQTGCGKTLSLKWFAVAGAENGLYYTRSALQISLHRVAQKSSNIYCKYCYLWNRYEKRNRCVAMAL